MSTDDYELITSAKITLSLKNVAKWFADLDDDSQARFFVEVCEAAKDWKQNFGANWQWYLIGSHLRNCECSSEAARDMIRALHDGLENGEH